MQSHVRFNRSGEGSLVQEPGQVQQGSGKGSGEGLGGFGAEPGQLQQGSENVWEALVQSHVRFNKICGHLIHGNRLRCFHRLALQHASERCVKIKRCGCWGIR